MELDDDIKFKNNKIKIDNENIVNYSTKNKSNKNLNEKLIYSKSPLIKSDNSLYEIQLIDIEREIIENEKNKCESNKLTNKIEINSKSQINDFSISENPNNQNNLNDNTKNIHSNNKIDFSYLNNNSVNYLKEKEKEELDKIQIHKMFQRKSEYENISRKYQTIRIKSDDNKKKDLVKLEMPKNVNKIHLDSSPLNMFFISLFSICSKKKSKKIDLYEKSILSIKNNMNILFYLKLIQEIEIIKTISFEYDQIGLLNFISKPLITNEENLKLPNSKEIEKIFNIELDLENVLDAYEKILQKKELNEMDHKLLKMLKVELDKIITPNSE